MGVRASAAEVRFRGDVAGPAVLYCHVKGRVFWPLLHSLAYPEDKKDKKDKKKEPWRRQSCIRATIASCLSAETCENPIARSSARPCPPRRDGQLGGRP